MQGRLDQSQDAVSPDSFLQPIRDADMGDFVEARFDVAFQYPLVGAGGEKVDLDDPGGNRKNTA